MPRFDPALRRGRPGPRNALTDVDGVTVGHAVDAAARTGVTAIRFETLWPAAMRLEGGGTATREAGLLGAGVLVGRLDAVVFSGGSTWGLAAADGAAQVLGAAGRGFRLRPVAGAPPSPLVAGACLHDLNQSGDKAWGDRAPYAELGRRAVGAAGVEFALGSVGAGAGAVAGDLKGGVGSASVVTEDGFTVAALAAVNSFGSVVGPDGSNFWAAPYELEREFGGSDPAELWAAPDQWPHAKVDPAAPGVAPPPPSNTTLVCVAIDAATRRDELDRIAAMAAAGVARAIRPVFAPFDGDVVYAVATERRPLPEDEAARAFVVARLGALAADTVARAIARGVYCARAFEDDAVEDWASRNAHADDAAG